MKVHWNKGRVHSEETRRKNSEGHKGLKASEETKQKLSVIQLGKQKRPRKAPKGASRGYDCSPEELVVRRAAREQREKYYTFPEPCPQGHLSERRVKSGICRKCEAEFGMKKYKEKVGADPTFIIYNMAKKRAKEQGVPFTVTREDVQALWPKDGLCPILGIKLESRIGKMGSQSQSPTLDKFIPSKGYVKGNMAIISHLANTIKSDIINPEIFRRMAGWLLEGTTLVGGFDVDRKYLQQKVMAAKKRAKEENVPFDITIEDILAVWPSDNRCPILGVGLQIGKAGRSGQGASPTLDKKNPGLGYVKGNIAIISYKANAIKQGEHTPEPFIKMAEWLGNNEGVTNGSN